MVDVNDLGSDSTPWSADQCASCVAHLREHYAREKRQVRNWNEGLEGEPSTALATALRGLYVNRSFDAAVAAFVDAGLVGVLLERLRRCPPSAERPLLRWGLFATYAYRRDAAARAALRLSWGRELKSFVATPTWRWLIGPIVGAVRCVVEGLADVQSDQSDDGASPSAEKHQKKHRLASSASSPSPSPSPSQQRGDSVATTLRSLALEALLPLLRPNDFAEWRDQIPLVATYLEEVGPCLQATLRAEPGLGALALRGVLDAWPATTTASTSKEVLLLGQLEDLLCARKQQQAGGGFALTDEALDEPNVVERLVDRLARCVGSENWRLCERGLHMWRRPDVAERLGGKRAKATVNAVLPALLRGGTPHWNPTVNRMTLLVLDRLEAMDAESFADCGAAEARKAAAAAHLVVTTPPPPSSSIQGGGQHEAADDEALLGRRTGAGSLTADMRGWRPESGAPPPSTLTGSAPWATKAVLSSFTAAASSSSTSSTKNKEAVSSPATFVARYREACASVARESSTSAGEATEARARWAADLVAERPARLPELKFHDLVFGRELGSGAFGVVKYAKRIVRASRDGPATLGRAHWPEFAVKVVSRAKVLEHDYARSIAREIGALQQLDHPGIARLVSAFRWRGDAYLVLEYAAGGDLHQTVLDEGALALASATFVLGSVVAAIEAVHDATLVFADLKPENVVLTAAGHVKLTDFGGCRGATPAARRHLHAVAKRALADLRDGDWRRPSSSSSSSASSWSPLGKSSAAAKVEDESTFTTTTTTKNTTTKSSNTSTNDASFADAFADLDDAAAADDDRVEGTLLYCAPEVACLGARPSTASDVWAIGCLAHFCLEARPRVEADDDDEARALLLAFDPRTAAFAPTTPPAAADFERALLQPDPARRPTLVDVAAMPFFADLDLPSIYRRPAPKLARANAGASGLGVVVPPHDAVWAQRQYSRIWAPLGAGADLPGAAAAAAVDGIVLAPSPAAADFHDLLGPWVQVHPIPALPAERRDAPFFSDAALPKKTLPPPSPTPAVDPLDHTASPSLKEHHDEPLDAIVEGD